jgi:hypothetical protein
MYPIKLCLKKKKSKGRKNVRVGAGAGTEINIYDSATLELIRTIFEARSFPSQILYDVRGRIQIHNTVFIRSMADSRFVSGAAYFYFYYSIEKVVMNSMTFYSEMQLKFKVCFYRFLIAETNRILFCDAGSICRRRDVRAAA